MKSGLQNCIDRIKSNHYTISAKKYLRVDSSDEEIQRRGFILNIILLFLFATTLVFNIVILIHKIIEGGGYTGISPFVMLGVTASIFGLYIYAKKVAVLPSAHVLICILTIGCIYGQIKWGADLPMVIMMWSVIIVTSSIIISTRYSFFLSICVTFLNITLALLENSDLYSPERTWLDDPFLPSDAIQYGLVLIVIAGISWLSNRETSKALHRARTSEYELKQERDSLEIKVLEKTEELRQSQIEKINDMYRFVEFGRIAGGLFHDLSSPLTALSLEISIAKDKFKGEKENDRETFSSIEAVSSRISSFLDQARKHIKFSKDMELFSIDKEVEQSIQMMSSKARMSGVVMITHIYSSIKTIGSPIIFSHVISNLISNAIDSYKSINQTEEKQVHIFLQRKKNTAIIKVKDFGVGISEDNTDKIFDSFFTTKGIDGCGIGLSASKHSLEKHFKGSISFKNNKTKGTTFTITFPIIKNERNDTKIPLPEKDI